MERIASTAFYAFVHFLCSSLYLCGGRKRAMERHKETGERERETERRRKKEVGEKPTQMNLECTQMICGCLKIQYLINILRMFDEKNAYSSKCGKIDAMRYRKIQQKNTLEQHRDITTQRIHNLTI